MRYLRFALLGLLALPAIVLGDGRAVPAHSAPITGEPVSQASLGNGKLQIHHIDVEHGDAALIISPNGQLAMVDDGKACSNTVSYLQSLGITSIDYHFASHYDFDHIACLDNMDSAGISVAVACYDRGFSKDPVKQFFLDYVSTCGDKRQSLSKGQVITLDPGAQQGVKINVVNLNGAAVYSGTKNENALSVVLKVSYGSFDEVMGGDLTGLSPEPRVESTVGPQVGDVEVYKIHHHGSATSTSDKWLDATTPEVGIISVGTSYELPKEEVLARLHNHGVRTYWTNLGSGVAPHPVCDKVGGTIVVEADPGANDSYTIYGSGFADSYENDGVTNDSDCDGVPDAIDNCPVAPNPDQSLPPWPIPADDPDCDGFSDADEGVIGTDPADACPDDPTDDAWPCDFDMNKVINLGDVFEVLPPFFGSSPSIPDTNDDGIIDWSPRRDLVPDGFINLGDVFLVLPPYFGYMCTP